MKPHPPQRCAGFSLVELMVALVLGLVIMAGVLSIFVGMSQSVRTETAISRLQENARFGLEKLSVDVRQAGFTGCVSTINVLLDTTAASYSPALYDLSRALSGWEYTGTGPATTFTSTTLAATGVPVGNWDDAAGADLDASFQNQVVPGSDVLIVRHAGPPLDLVADGNTPVNAADVNLKKPSGVPQDTIVLISDCAGADLFQNRSIGTAHKLNRDIGGSAPGNVNPASQNFSHEYDGTLQVYTFSISAYYIGTGDSGEPTLFRRTYPRGDAGETEELIDGVETMQVRYGEDTDGDRIADVYRAANTVGDWARVVSVKLGLLLRQRDEGRGEVDTATYGVGGMTFNPLDVRNVRRRTMNWTITLRNRVP